MKPNSLHKNFQTQQSRHSTGVPVSLKDCFDLAGYVTTGGSRFYAERNPPAPEDSAVAARLRSQGAVVGKTHASACLRHHRRKYGLRVTVRDLAIQFADRRARPAAPRPGVQEGSALAAIGTDTAVQFALPPRYAGLRAIVARSSWRTNAISGAADCVSQTFDTLGWLFRDMHDAPVLASALFGLAVHVIDAPAFWPVRWWYPRRLRRHRANGLPRLAAAAARTQCGGNRYIRLRILGRRF